MRLEKLKHSVEFFVSRTNPERSQGSYLNIMVTNQKSGQTIVEVAVALAILTILASALVGIGLASVHSTTEAKLKSQASRFAEEALEVARHTRDLGTTSTVQSLLSIANGSGLACVDPDEMKLSDCDQSESIENIFTRTIAVSDASPGGDPNSRVLISVVVTWGGGGDDQKVQMRTYLSRWLTN